MLFARINRADPERVLIIVKAAEALHDGRPVCYHFDGTGDGKDAYRANAATDATVVVGLADEAIASGDYGRVLVYGLKTNAQAHGASNFADNCGAQFSVDSKSSGCLEQGVSLGAATAVQPNFVYAQSASTALSAGLRTMGVFVRCM